MTRDAKLSGADAGDVSPAFLGAILGAVESANGDPLGGWMRARLVKLAASALAEVLGRAAGIRALDPMAAPPEFELACAVGPAAPYRPCTLLLDASAIRAVVDPLLSDHLAVRGAGPPLESERGIVEYAVEAWADALACRIDDPHLGPVVQSFAHGPNPALAGAPTGCATCFRLSIPPHEGTLGLVWPAEQNLREVLARARAMHGGEIEDDWLNTCCTVRVALRPIDLGDVNVSSIEPGDALLLGATSLEHLSAEATLCSDSGWTIGRVQIRHDSAATLSVELLNVDPWPQSTHADSAIVYALVGSLELTGAQIREIRRGTRLDLVKPDAGPVVLRSRGRDVARCELVTVRGEVGARVTERCATSQSP